MKFLYMTDLHGKWNKYNYYLNKVQKSNYDILFLGGDIYPDGIKSVPVFLEKVLPAFFDGIEKEKIPLFFILGNTDYACFDEDLDTLCSKYTYINNVTNTISEYRGWSICGFPYVPDTPLAIKDRCRLDTYSIKIFIDQLSVPKLTQKVKGEPLYFEIPVSSWEEYLMGQLSLAEELEQLPKPADFKKAVYLMHSPPASSGLDYTAKHERIGSQAIFDFILKYQPFLTLHGHVHESVHHSEVWKTKLQETTAINPGHSEHGNTYVEGNLNTATFDFYM